MTALCDSDQAKGSDHGHCNSLFGYRFSLQLWCLGYCEARFSRTWQSELISSPCIDMLEPIYAERSIENRVRSMDLRQSRNDVVCDRQERELRETPDVMARVPAVDT